MKNQIEKLVRHWNDCPARKTPGGMCTICSAIWVAIYVYDYELEELTHDCRDHVDELYFKDELSPCEEPEEVIDNE